MTGIAVDRDLTPEYPGITEADTIGAMGPAVSGRSETRSAAR